MTDTLYIGLYYSRGAYLYALLMIAYTVIAVIAYLNWRKLAEKQAFIAEPEEGDRQAI